MSDRFDTQWQAERLPRLVDWIGEVPIFHGERDDSQACLCGEPDYLLCPEFMFDSPMLRIEIAHAQRTQTDSGEQ